MKPPNLEKYHDQYEEFVKLVLGRDATTEEIDGFCRMTHEIFTRLNHEKP